MESLSKRAGLLTASNYQVAIFEAVENSINQIREGETPKSLIIEAKPGSGKCLGVGTPILMFDGSIKAVEDIGIGELLMGPDSLPREVLSTNRGYGRLIEIVPIKGDRWVCNDVHVMTMIDTRTKEIVDIPLKQHLANNNSHASKVIDNYEIHNRRYDHDLKLLRRGVSFPSSPVPFSPYLIGLWIGDGTSDEAAFTNVDPEVIAYLEEIGCNNIIGKKIPDVYLINDREVRLSLLAGIIDTDGSLSGNRCYEIITKWKHLSDQILYLARSLGFAAYKSQKRHHNRHGIMISGNTSEIPVLIPRKNPSPRQQIKDVLHTGWKPIDIGEGEYYGFTLNGDGRFLLGDFTVTHNTTTGVAATRLIPRGMSTIFVAFNKKIADELVTRLPPGIPAKTFHAFWLKQWGRSVQNRRGAAVKINNFKIRNAVDKHFGINRFNRKKKKHEQADDVVFLVEKAKMFGVVPHDYSNAESVTGYEDNEFFWLHVLSYFNYQIDPTTLKETIEIAREILRGQLDNETEVDFADMLYLPAVKHSASEKFQIVLIDESQDLNGIQRYLLTQMVNPNGMIIATGDSRQSIYSFCGADVEAMENIKSEFDCAEYPLSISYRCAKTIIDEANTIYNEIEAAPNAPLGSVEHPDFWKVEDFRPGHLIICRNNAPTVSLAYKLIRARIPAKVLGRDIGQGLIKLIVRLDIDNTLPELITRLRNWRDNQIELIERKEPNDERSKEQIRDKYECIANIASSEEINNVQELLAVIDNLFTQAGDENQTVSTSRVTLSTIHKIKGAEADTVFILDAHLINPPWVQKEWEVIQEHNLRFVGITRAKNRLIYIKSDTIRT